MKNTVSAPDAPAIKVFIMARLINTEAPSEIPNDEPPLKKHQHIHNERHAKVM